MLSYIQRLQSSLRIHAGAAMAVEDGAALAEALRHAYSADDIIPVLKVYQDVRIKRSSQMQQASLVNGVVFHFPDGPEQEARDAAMQAEVEGRVFTESPNQWSDPTTQAWTCGYDAVGAVADAFQEVEVPRNVVESSKSKL
jgi:salicylate hydroxylase